MYLAKFQTDIEIFIELHGNSKLLMTSCPPPLPPDNNTTNNS